MEEEKAYKIEQHLRNLEKCFCAKHEKEGIETIEEIRKMLVPPLVKSKAGYLNTEILSKSFSEK